MNVSLSTFLELNVWEGRGRGWCRLHQDRVTGEVLLGVMTPGSVTRHYAAINSVNMSTCHHMAELGYTRRQDVDRKPETRIAAAEGRHIPPLHLIRCCGLRSRAAASGDTVCSACGNRKDNPTIKMHSALHWI